MVSLDRMRVKAHPIGLFRGFSDLNFSRKTKDRLTVFSGTVGTRTHTLPQKQKAPFLIGHSFKKGAFFVSPKIWRLPGRALPGKRAPSYKSRRYPQKGRRHQTTLGRRKSGALFHLEGNAMAKSIGTIHSWKEIPIPYRCEGCPYPKVGFVCYGKDGSCLRSDVQEIEARQAPEAQDKFVGFGYRFLTWKTVCCWVGKEEAK